MKHISTITSQPPEMKRPMGSDQLNQEQRDAVGYFFARLKLFNSAQYDALMPDETTERLTKREYAAHLIGFTRDQIDKGLAAYHDARQSGIKGFEFLDIDRAIGMVKHGGNAEGNPARIHKPFEPLALPDKTAQEKARKAGASELEKMRGMFE